ncbi:MAG TPA: YceI family protein [Opitutaceae bacterium]|nr:YceI family protein [Opitutaceae bacterium]
MKRIAKLFIALSAFTALVASASAAVETYAIDPVHSSIAFSIRHFFSKVPGSFSKFDGTIVVDRDNLEKSSAEVTIDIGSLNTANEKRDTHVKSPDFLDAAKFPTITFKSTSWKKTGPDSYDVSGNLTIKGTTKPVVLKVKSLGFGPGMKGVMLSGWEAATALKRSDFGVTGFEQVLGDDVDVTISVEADLKK